MEIFVVTHPTVVSRNENMERRLSYFNLLDRTHFIYGEDKNSKLVEHYSYEGNKEYGPIACLLGHIKALKEFVKTETPYACILEDDVLLHNNFKERLDTIHMDEDIELIQLFTMSENEGKTRRGIYGTQGYIIRREYAISCLHKYDKPLAYWDKDTFQSSEAIVMYSNGIILSENPLVIEDMSSSTIGNTDFAREHQNIYDHIVPVYKNGLHNYMMCDDEYNLDPYYISYVYHILMSSSLQTKDLKYILERFSGPATMEQTLYIATLYMLCEFYLDSDAAEYWADVYYYILDNYPVSEIVEKESFMTYISQFYQRE